MTERNRERRHRRENGLRWQWFVALCDGDVVTTPYEWAVAAALFRRMNYGGYCYPSRATVAADARVSIPTVIAVTDRLASLGWLRIDRRRSRKPHEYYAAIPQEAVADSTRAPIPQVEPVTPQHRRANPQRLVEAKTLGQGRRTEGRSVLEGKGLEVGLGSNGDVERRDVEFDDERFLELLRPLSFERRST